MENVTNSKYLINKEQQVFSVFTAVLVCVPIIMPPYFGIPVPGFDLTMIRIMLIIMVVMIVANKDRLYGFVNTTIYNYAFWILVPYIFVTFYTMVFRTDLKTFLNPFIEIVIFFITIYAIRESIGIEKTISIILVCYYIMAIQGLIEYARGESLFKLLRTLDGALVGGSFVRSGQYRIMGPAPHSIAYGMILDIGIPLSALDLKTNKIYLFRRPVLLILLFTNIVFSGSRSSLAVFFLEVGLLFILSSKYEMKKTILIGVVFLMGFGVFLAAFSGTSVGNYFLLQIANIIDELFGTEYAVQFGATAITQQSSEYRDALWYVFKVKWLNPLVGRGRAQGLTIKTDKGIVIGSLDNYYIVEYVMYAYPGMFSYIFFMIVPMIMMLVRVIKEKDGFSKAFLILSIGYAWGLYYVDSLGTLKFLYLMYALFVCYDIEKFTIHDKRKKSMYLRQKVYERA